MAAQTKIEWTATVRDDGTITPGATFNPWRGCTKISEECERCYAETMSVRNPAVLGIWGPLGTRVVAAERYWAEPYQWDYQARIHRQRKKVFCASLADVFEEWMGLMTDHRQRDLFTGPLLNRWWVPYRSSNDRKLTMDDTRLRLFRMIEDTPNLDWLLLTKRLENVLEMVPRAWKKGFPSNVWMGTTIGVQRRMDQLEKLVKIPARVRWLSVEPLLEPLTFPPDLLRQVHWGILGGESGHGARECDLTWMRDILAQFRAAGVAPFVKQLGANPVETHANGLIATIPVRDRKGVELDDFPDDLRIREFPKVR